MKTVQESCIMRKTERKERTPLNTSPLRDIKFFLLDMDGTIYLGDRLFEGTKEFLHHIRAILGDL